MRAGAGTAFAGIARREALRFTNQRERFLAALVRPLVWLFIFAAGFRSVLGLSITPPYQTYVLYEVYVTPGLCGMILLFSGMQSSLSMVYDRETGAMRSLLVSPYPRWFLLGSKLLASVLVSVCDKRHNLGTIAADVREHGVAYLRRFSGTPAQQLWYFRGILRAGGTRIPSKLRAEMRGLLRELAAATGA